jgi:hypothetical protein
MKSIQAIAVSLVLALGCFVHEATAKNSMVEGTVMMSNSTTLMLIAKSGDPVEFAVPSTAKVTRDGKPAKLEELQARDQVSVLASSGEERVATDVHARSPF